MNDNNSCDRSIANKVLSYPCGEVPQVGCAREIVPGILWVRMPLPFSLNHVNLWILRDGDGWAAIDAGLQSSETAAAWRRLCGSDGALEGRRITRVFATHMHRDHVGMIGWLTRRHDCRLYMTRLEYLTCRVLAADSGREAPKDGVDFYHRAGWNDDAIENYRARFGGFGKFIYALPDSYRRLFDGESLQIDGREWRVVVGYGHSPEQACLYCPSLNVLISGDQVLPKISSNVAVFPTEPDADPLSDWLFSLDKLQREVPDDVLVLPAHNEPFLGLHTRLAQLRDDARAAIGRLRGALSDPKRAIDVFGELFARPIGSEPELLGMATGESLAHLNYLISHGEAIKDIDKVGVAWYCLRSCRGNG
ncbi:MBL fold metallo-hydrolase [Georgfuchsia toluolica]|uniref:MBL fold metallo-hydrolase n=1 Tax=Georgfuchsia toluolica TaxID=424218 RepID=UPI001C736AFA|nr:MBL fold metallo-hydrolase [Georgfuchsia toluolica]